MTKAKLYAYLVLAILCVAAPLVLLVLFYHTPAIPGDLAAYEYFAVTSPTGKETVYPKGDATFLSAASAFTGAAPVSALPAELEESLFLLAEWIRDGRAQPFRLYLSPSALEGYLVDERGNGFRLKEKGALFFLISAFSSSLLVGEEPPALTVNGQAIPFALCRWSYTLRPSEGAPVTVSSGEYTNTAGGTYPIDPSAFAPQFDEAPDSTVYTVYLSAEEVLSSSTCPDLSALPAGDYQLVLVAEWQRGDTRIRAGYSMLFSRS